MARNFNLSASELVENERRLEAEIARANAGLAVFNEGYAAGVDHWPPCSNPYLGNDRGLAKAWSRGRAAAMPGSAYQQLRQEFDRQDSEWYAFIGRNGK